MRGVRKTAWKRGLPQRTVSATQDRAIAVFPQNSQCTVTIYVLSHGLVPLYRTRPRRARQG